MSEYQYYEFQAIDHPLDERAMADLRSITSRAEITPTSLTNVYHFGSFKGNPDRLMEQYFDAHLYLANWGTHRLMLRLPARSFAVDLTEPYCVPDVLEARNNKQHTIIEFNSDEEGGDDDEGGEGWLASLIPLRSNLAAGDLRSLYLGWLAGVESGQVDEDSPEPPVPPGLGKLSGPLRRLADFLRIDPVLIKVAAASSEEDAPISTSSEELVAWVAQLPQAEKDALLVQLMQGEALHLSGELLQRFRKDRTQRQAQVETEQPPGRTAAALLQARDRLAAEERRREAEQSAKKQAKLQREQAEARARHLDNLAGREEELWQQVEAVVATRLPKEYDRAVDLLKDLRDLGQRTGKAAGVANRIRELRNRHAAKRTLIQRLDRASL